MYLKKTWIAATLAVLAAAGAAPALAQQSAEVSVTRLDYRLVDLAPDDGIAASLAWTASEALAYARVYDVDGNEIEGAQIEALGSTGIENGHAGARVDALEDGAHMRLDLYSGYGYASANRSLRFTLSPHTQVIFTADADLWASPDPAAGSLPTALAEIYGSLHGMGDGDWTFHARAQVDGGRQHGSLAVTAMSADGWTDGILSYSTYAVAESQALPVPEPQTSAMLLGGLVFMALAGQRRRHHHRR